MSKKVLLLGAEGYIGSRFNIEHGSAYNIHNTDLRLFEETKYGANDFKYLTKQFINSFDSVILLAGHSSVKMCDGNPASSLKNNVNNFVDLLDKLSPTQKFIYASSSSIYGHTNKKVVTEDYTEFYPNNYYDLTKYVIDLYASKSNKNYYGLRLGTVNGWSPKFRCDIMINSMVHSAKTNGYIRVYAKNILRPILGIRDLCRALSSIIEKDNSIPGIYNLASFNSTPESIANAVAKVTNVNVKEFALEELTSIKNINLQKNAYDFAISSEKFTKEFNFTFKETTESITSDILEKYTECIKTFRNDFVNYE